MLRCDIIASSAWLDEGQRIDGEPGGRWWNLSSLDISSRGFTLDADSAQTGLLKPVSVFNPQFLFPLLPYYLTLVKHYMAEQKVHRADSYPPELVFLHIYERDSVKI